MQIEAHLNIGSSFIPSFRLTSQPWSRSMLIALLRFIECGRLASLSTAQSTTLELGGEDRSRSDFNSTLFPDLIACFMDESRSSRVVMVGAACLCYLLRCFAHVDITCRCSSSVVSKRPLRKCAKTEPRLGGELRRIGTARRSLAASVASVASCVFVACIASFTFVDFVASFTFVDSVASCLLPLSPLSSSIAFVSPACTTSKMSSLQPDLPHSVVWMEMNLLKLYGTDSAQCVKKHQKIVRKRCLYIQERLAADDQIRWAQTNRPNLWIKRRWQDFTSSVWNIQKINNGSSEWSDEVLECLKKLESTELRFSEGFKHLYESVYFTTEHSANC